MSRTLSFTPPGMIMSPGFWPFLHSPAHFASMVMFISAGPGIFLCLQFDETKVPLGTGRREVTRKEVIKALDEAEKTHLVPRPFRDYDDKVNTYGICFCCDCCCDYFATENPSPCDKGLYIERTDEELCNHCGTCEDFCYFGARIFDGDVLEVHPDECYGCGVCVDVCPEGAVEMVLKESIG